MVSCQMLAVGMWWDIVRKVVHWFHNFTITWSVNRLSKYFVSIQFRWIDPLHSQAQRIELHDIEGEFLRGVGFVGVDEEIIPALTNVISAVMQWKFKLDKFS